ncbi:hypothetical protein INR49_024077 [Caranx melampygus]|nr:hypothetical protein INR49_024077 [Caranx melampygus]
MTPTVHLLLPLLFSIAAGKDLEEKKGPFENVVLNVPEATPVPYPMYQFQVTHPGVNNFRLSGEGKDDIQVSNDGWLFLEKSLDWSQDHHYEITVEALEDETVVAGVPFTRVFALDKDDPGTPNARLRYSLVSQIPTKQHVLLFQINPVTGEISTTEQGEQLIKAREGILSGREEDQSVDALKTKFNDYCPGQRVPYEENPFFTCVERAEMRRRNVDPLEDPDYTLFIRVQDLEGESETALSGNTRVHIAVQQNLWVNPGPIHVKENLKETYPLKIAQVQSNDPHAIYKLVQKERLATFPFQIKANGEIFLTEELDREAHDMYILVVMALDSNDKEVDPPMEIQVLVEDVNDNSPMCENVETVFELQENEPAEGTLNSLLAFTIVSQQPPTATSVFSIDAASGRIQALRSLQRKEQRVYNLNVNVTDTAFSTECKVVIKIIDINNELPLFEKSDYGSHTLVEDTPVGHTVVTIRATDADDPESGSSRIDFHIVSGNDGNVFTVETDGTGVGHVVIAKPMDFESSPVYKLQIDARNPEPLMPGLHFKLDGDTRGWLQIDAATGEIKTKEKLDRETVESFEVTVTAFEKENPAMTAERAVKVRLLDVNDNYPTLVEKDAFICMMQPKPVLIKARDGDSAPFSEPFTFSFANQKKSPNWELTAVDGTSARLVLKKKPVEERTYSLVIKILDNAGVGVNNSFDVKVCNCTELGYCYIAPEGRNFRYGMGPTIGILGGTLGFCLLILFITIKRSNKKNKKGQSGEEGRPMMS